MEFSGLSYLSLPQILSQSLVAERFQFVASKVVNIQRSPPPCYTQDTNQSGSLLCVSPMGTVALSPVSLVNINWMGTEWELEMEIAISEIIPTPNKMFCVQLQLQKGLWTE